MVKLSGRLLSLSKYILPEDKVMDVGCDHALLDIFLVEQGILGKIYVGDVNPNALQNGKENIEKSGLTGRVVPILSYGIEKINELDVNTIIISGMGSKNIIDILSSPNLDKVYKLVLQSNNNHNELRRFLARNHFKIFHEEIVPDGKKTYINIVAGYVFDEVVYNDVEYEFGPILSRDKTNLDYFRSLHKTYEDIYFRSKSDDAKEKLYALENVIKELDKKEDL